MEPLTRAPRGTEDVLPGDSYKWQYMEAAAMGVAADFGYREIRTPVFEHTELFVRSVGDTTDVVQKEMYTFTDKGNRSVTLRPEGTAGAARCLLEHNLHNGVLPVKVSYLTSCYRYEKPQAGRLREFHQFGVECFGAAAPQADAEIILLFHTVLKRLRISGVSLHINSIGCPDCRAAYHEVLRGYLADHREELCVTCRERATRNPMRVLDCKAASCAGLVAAAPRMLEHLCGDCRAHFDAVQGYLNAAGVAFAVDTGIVRGLDYYTRTVFEFVSDHLGAQSVIGGGGRYDGLIGELGGPRLPSLGFGMGLERVLMVMDACGAKIPLPHPCEAYFVPMGAAAAARCFALVATLRESGVSAEMDIIGRGVKAQMKYADKLGARYTVVVGDNEMETGRAILRNMETGGTEEVALDESLAMKIYKRVLDRRLAGVTRIFGENME